MWNYFTRLFQSSDPPEPGCDHDWKRRRTKRMASWYPEYNHIDGTFLITTAEYIMEWKCARCYEVIHPNPKAGPPKVEGTTKKHRAEEVESWPVEEADTKGLSHGH